MGGYIFNVLQSAKKIKDFLVSQGPVTLRNAGEVFGWLQELSDRTADYIDQFGSQTTIAAGQGHQFQGGVDGDDAQKYLAELQEIRAFGLSQVESLRAEGQVYDDQIQRAVKANLGGGLIAGILGKISPNVKGWIWSIAVSLIDQVLTKSGISPPPVSPPTTPPASAEKHGHAKK